MLKSYKNNFINIHQMRQKQLTPAVLTDVRISLFVCFWICYRRAADWLRAWLLDFTSVAEGRKKHSYRYM